MRPITGMRTGNEANSCGMRTGNKAKILHPSVFQVVARQDCCGC